MSLMRRQNVKMVGITGLAGSGKTEFAKALSRELSSRDCDVETFAIAGPIKQLASAMGWDGKKDALGRRLLQTLGTECGRNCIGENVWIDKWIETAMEDGCDVAIADDVRFDNEAEAIRRRGGFIVHMCGRGGLSGHVGLHASERGVLLADGDGVVNNGADGLGALAKAAAVVADRVFARPRMVYVCGPMRGRQLYNFPAFDAEANRIRGEGHAAVSPADIDRDNGFEPSQLPYDFDWNSWPDGLDIRDVARRDLLALLKCDEIRLLPGYQQSAGAMAELAVAKWIGIAVVEAEKQKSED